MTLTLNANKARKADTMSNIIRETGKYTGIITRAEKLVSRNKVQGVGLSFQSDDGGTANYLDVYTTKPDGEELWGASIVQSILCCTKVKSAEEGPIKFKKWDKEAGEMVETTAVGYPALMNKRIGFVLQKELQTHSVTGEDSERIGIARVFEAATGLTASEILDGKTKAEKIDLMLKTLQPVRDSRKKRAAAPAPAPAADGDFDDDIPF